MAQPSEMFSAARLSDLLERTVAYLRATPLGRLFKSESLTGEITRWSLLLLAIGLLATLAIGELTKRATARNLADFAMIDFVREEIEPALNLCGSDDARCLLGVLQNETGGIWRLTGRDGVERSSFSYAVIGLSETLETCARADPRRAGAFRLFTCAPADGGSEFGSGIGYRIAQRDGNAALVALEIGNWESRVDRATERLVGWRSLRLALGASVATLFALLIVNVVLTRARLRAHFDRLGRELDAFRDGAAARIEGAYPAEIQDLVTSFNRTLAKNAGLVDRQRRNVNKMAHDLRHQLVNIDVAARGEQPGEELGPELETLNQLVERYLTLVDWVGPGEGQQPVDVKDALEMARKAFARRFREEPVEIEVDCPEGLEARAHPTDLKIILNNLVGNAHKYARARIRLSARRATDAVELIVADDGPGVPEAERRRILDWGARLDDRVAGSGFGLTIVAEQVRELYGGEVALGESDLGGLEVRVSLPAALRV